MRRSRREHSRVNDVRALTTAGREVRVRRRDSESEKLSLLLFPSFSLLFPPFRPSLYLSRSLATKLNVSRDRSHARARTCSCVVVVVVVDGEGEGISSNRNVLTPPDALVGSARFSPAARAILAISTRRSLPPSLIRYV